MNQYKEWIDDWVKTNRVSNNCWAGAHEMKKAFPELALKRGFVYTNHGTDLHWWLESSDGTVIDPTASQFGTVFEYEEYRDGAPIKLSKCMECGETIYAFSIKEAEERTNNFCQKSCEQKFIDRLNNI